MRRALLQNRSRGKQTYLDHCPCTSGPNKSLTPHLCFHFLRKLAWGASKSVWKHVYILVFIFLLDEWTARRNYLNQNVNGRPLFKASPHKANPKSEFQMKAGLSQALKGPDFGLDFQTFPI